MLDARDQDLQRQILRDGATYQVVGHDQASQRPWALGLLPWVLDAASWEAIEPAVRQRARLLQWLAQDLYGEQTALRAGAVPWPLIARHPSYLRPMVGVQPLGGAWLSVVAFDLTRDAQGRWCVLTQRCQAPSGLGYALHNRIRVREQFPQAFKQLRIQRLASTYGHLLQGLAQRAALVSGHEPPRLALLTPGPYSETYFEQVYLARYLGLPLVEGHDLCVQGDTLFLKTVDGLQPIHGLLRRLDDDWCDPLELRADSQLGTPGLLQVLRAGRLAMSNTPGCGVLETPALHGFLPQLCQDVLGEPLALPSVDSWWCGEAAARASLQQTGQAALWRASFPQAGLSSQVFGVARAEPADLAADPAAFTAQRPLDYWRAPLWQQGRLHHRPALLRVLAVLDAQGEWQVLPGGMARVAPDDNNRVSMQKGGISLDVWVQARGEVDAFSMGAGRGATATGPGRPQTLTSRTAENLFWLGRYTERAEQGLQLMRQTLSALDTRSELPPPMLDALAGCARRAGLLSWTSPPPSASPGGVEAELLQGLQARAEPATQGLAFTLQALSQAARALPERLSAEHLRWIDRLSQLLGPTHRAAAGAGPNRQQARTLMDDMGLCLAALVGAQSDRMTRDQGWRFLTLGRLLERLIHTGANLQALLGAGALDDENALDLLLQLMDSSITFRARHQRRSDAAALEDVLVTDVRNPRSLAGIRQQLRAEWQQLPPAQGLPMGPASPEPPMGVPAPSARGEGPVPALAHYAGHCAQSGAEWAQNLAEVYFSPVHSASRAV